MHVKLRQAADFLGVSEKMLLRWAKQGLIPAYEENDDYLFESKAIEAWDKKRKLSKSEKSNHSIVPKNLKKANLYSAMKQGGVHFGIKGNSVEELLKNAVSVISLPKNIEKEDVLSKLLEREKLVSTGIGNGLAIPHPRHPMEFAHQGGSIATCFLEQKCDFNSVDKEPVFVLFLIFCPSTDLHLQLLSKLSFCLHDMSFLDYIKKCNDENGLLAHIKKLSSKLDIDNEGSK